MASQDDVYYVYILRSQKDEKLYTGYTDNLRRRLAQHKSGKNISTRSRLPLDLVYYEAYSSQADAKAREFRLKNSQGARTALKRRLPECLRQGHSV